MNSIHLNKTDDTPEVIFDADKQLFSIKGKSLPENAMEFYKPLYDWIVEYSKTNLNNGITLHIDLEYLNSSSIKLVFLIFSKIDEYYSLTSNKSSTNINWFYKKDDELTKIKGEEFKDLLKTPFNLIVKD